MSEESAQLAIQAALAGKWEEAIEINKKILKEDPQDIDSLNRIARAYAEIGNIDKAKATAKKVLKLDLFNTIAAKSLKKWKGVRSGDSIRSKTTSAEAFLEEPGKTKIVPLLHLGDKITIASLDSGDELDIKPHGHRIALATLDGKYVGKLPDDLSARLRMLIKHGNEYQVLIKSIEPTCVRVFIRETKRTPKLADTNSFSTEKIDYISFTPPELVHRKEIVTQIEEED